MDKATMAKVFTREELCSINRCRLYLQVFYLSDIVSGNGRKLLHEAHEGQILTQRQSKWQWPWQTRPPNSDWKLWRIAITDVWINSETDLLTQPLGKWIGSSHQIFKFVYDVHDDAVIETFTNGTLHRYTKFQGVTRNSQLYFFDKQIFSIPSNVVPIQVHKPSNTTIYGESHLQEVFQQP